MTINVADFVKYKGEVAIVTNQSDDKCHIMQPHKTGGVRLQVKQASLSSMGMRAATIRHKTGWYMVTSKGTIISYTTGKLMKWGDNNPTRLSILSLSQPYFGRI